jgi:hypothetical protein
MDAKRAFLNGDLREDIFMEVPVVLTSQTKTLCANLNGLKQSARCWYVYIFEIKVK